MFKLQLKILNIYKNENIQTKIPESFFARQLFVESFIPGA